MDTDNYGKKLIDDIEAQLNCDNFLGGYWLPIDNKALEMPLKITNQDPSIEQNKADKARALSELYALIEQCYSCRLGDSRIKVVPGRGNPDSRIVFIGQGPDQQEDEQGLAFVGRAGQLLSDIIKAMGLKLEDVYVTNIVKCHRGANAELASDELSVCMDYLHQQLNIIEPEIIVALGQEAASILLDSKATIGQLKGKVHQYIPGDNARPIKLVATYHPVYLLQNYTTDTRLSVWKDMQLVLRELGLPIPGKR